ncbi:Major facilitator superfamily protein isoform 1 [Hibiscus syriacus]|uniref:Major facilitator superfamily protein isoform 1 n=1 Tax=Hibiscus syriacus TaxID=106335 RepID=A0A6A2Z695_HIBSY|nr:Major facilitator superfamily protein isoform 1 [Hibiscus syriacus]
MDWYSWLSKTALDPSLIYEYGLSFSRNELQREDLAYFNHEFLQSMGLSVAKHRLEILKLARKEVGETPNSLSKLVLAITKTRECFNKYVNKLVHHEHSAIKPLPSEPVRCRDQWRGGLTKKCKSDKRVQEKVLAPPRSLKLSGPLDRKMQEKLVLNYRSPVKSGPIDIAMAQERLLLTNRSPKLSGPLNYVRPPTPKIQGDYKEKTGRDYDDQTLWAATFQDMKPT